MIFVFFRCYLLVIRYGSRKKIRCISREQSIISSLDDCAGSARGKVILCSFAIQIALKIYVDAYFFIVCSYPDKNSCQFLSEGSNKR